MVERTQPHDPYGTPTRHDPTGPAKRKRKGAHRITNGLVALSSVAILSVYGVGYARTQAAADAMAAQERSAGAVVRSTADAPSVGPASAPETRRTGRIPGGVGSVSPAAGSGGSAASPATATIYRDGTYVGMGTGRHGSIEATVVIQGGKIVSAQISQCLTRYPCSLIGNLPGQVVDRQSAAVDLVSRATDSSLAFRAAVTKALAQAQAA